jgi:ATP-dependent 26S proteasome regulatory subunit
MKEKVKENTDKIKVFKVLPYLVSNVVEVSTTTTGLMRTSTVVCMTAKLLFVSAWSQPYSEVL